MAAAKEKQKRIPTDFSFDVIAGEEVLEIDVPTYGDAPAAARRMVYTLMSQGFEPKTIYFRRQGPMSRMGWYQYDAEKAGGLVSVNDEDVPGLVPLPEEPGEIAIRPHPSTKVAESENDE